MKVLLVDDDPEIRTSVRVGFELQWPGVEVVEAGDGAEALRLVEEEVGPVVYWGREVMGALFDVWDRFSADQGWLVSRPTSGGLNAIHLLDVGEDLGLCSRVGKRIVLDEKLFLRLSEDAEARLTYEHLLPLEDRFHAWLCSQEE